MKDIDKNINTCIVCGCPQIANYNSVYYHSEELHFKNCKLLKNERYKYANKTSGSFKEKIGELIKGCKEEIVVARQQIKEFTDCLKKTCLDEVYECRWDCCIVPR